MCNLGFINMLNSEGKSDSVICKSILRTSEDFIQISKLVRFQGYLSYVWIITIQY